MATDPIGNKAWDAKFAKWTQAVNHWPSKRGGWRNDIETKFHITSVRQQNGKWLRA